MRSTKARQPGGPSTVGLHSCAACLLKCFVELSWLFMNTPMEDLCFLELQTSFSNLPICSISLPALRSSYEFCAVFVSGEAQSYCSLSVCQFNKLFYDLDPIIGLLWRKAGQVGRREGERECEVKGWTPAYWDCLFKLYTEFFPIHITCWPYLLLYLIAITSVC